MWYVWVTSISSPRLYNLTHILKILALGSSPTPLATFCLGTRPRPKTLIFHSKVFLSHKKSPNLKIFDDVIFHVICGLLPPNQKSWLCLCQKFKKFLCLVIFLFNLLKHKTVLEPRKGHFWELVGFKTKAKDFKMCPQERPRGQGCPRGLHLCLQYF